MICLPDIYIQQGIYISKREFRSSGPSRGREGSITKRICETLSWVSDFKKGVPSDLHLDAKGRLRTRLLQVFAKRGGGWEIVVYHNVDIKPDVETPEPK
jgi:hypothetical protein